MSSRPGRHEQRPSREGTGPELALAVALLAAGVGLRPLFMLVDVALWTNRTWRSAVGPILRVVGVVLACGAATFLLLGAAFMVEAERPRLGDFLHEAPPTVGRIEDGNGRTLAELAREYRRPFAAHELPPVLVDALLAAEDRAFFEHKGVDLMALPRVVVKAAEATVRARRLMLPQGGSTITQQLVRSVLLRQWRARESGNILLCDSLFDRAVARALGVPLTNKLRRKAEEIRLAYWLEAELAELLGSRAEAKREILRRYATYVYLGQGRYGFASAAEHYLGRPLKQLRRSDAAQAALLAGLPKSPAEYAPVERNRERARRRRDHVLGLMARRGFITEAERLRYVAEPIPLVAQARGPQCPPASATVVNVLFEELRRVGDARISASSLYDGRLVVRSTAVMEIQEILSGALEEGLRRYEARHPEASGVVQGSAVVLANGDARILALAGGRLLFAERPAGHRDFNRATESRRQPGSALKPLVYLAAFRHGASLDSQVLDGPVAVGMGGNRPPKWIANYDGGYRGWITLRRALAESRNAATVRLVAAVGVPQMLRTARELGIHSRLQPFVTTALGASEVTLLELANFYRSIASGLHTEPWLLERVTTTDGMELFRHVPRGSERLNEHALALVQEALRGVVRLPGATAHALASLPVPVMGKTGTTNDFRDALFVGSTFGPSGVTVAVRIGFDDNHSLGPGETGARVALPVFRDTIVRLYGRGLVGPAPRFPPALEQGIDEYLHGLETTDSAGGPELTVDGPLLERGSAEAGPAPVLPPAAAPANVLPAAPHEPASPLRTPPAGLPSNGPRPTETQKDVETDTRGGAGSTHP
jgi:penicillin-binding protein 1A